MKWFDNIKLASKLGIAFTACLFLCVVAGICAISRMAAINDSTSQLYNESVKGEGLLVRVTSDLKQYRTWQIRYGVMKDPAGWKVCDDALAKLETDTTADIENYRRNARFPDDVSNAKTLAAQWRDSIAQTPNLRKVCQTGSIKQIQDAIVASFVPIKAAEENIDKIADWNSKHANQLADDASRTYTSARTLVISLLLIAIALGALMATMVTKSIIAALAGVSEHLRSLDQGFEGLAANTDALSNGDFIFREVHRTAAIQWDRKDEFGDLARTFDSMREWAKKSIDGVIAAQASLSNMVGEARRSADSIVSASAQLASGNEDLAARTTEQASSLEETAASMEEMTSVVKQSADNAGRANALASEARTVAVGGGETVRQAVTSMATINESSKKIADIISVIDEIAFQTNLLALNAAVEAARVGEQGKGFAVVAAEVRNLAGRSSTAAKEIKTLVADSVQKVEGGTELVNKSGEQLQAIVAAVDKVAEIVSEISAAAQEQSSGIDQVNKAVIQLDEITQQNAALVEEATAASQAMSHQASELSDRMRHFRLDESKLSIAVSQPAVPRAGKSATGANGQSLVHPGSRRTPLRVVGGSGNSRPVHDEEEF
ncbi:MAG: methyl-accepting chemotaxis protein [Capsulimonadaceae bacterium]|nr:methyl-accepting chemotaxis protein [Capsulimonadaceae bacterium]